MNNTYNQLCNNLERLKLGQMQLHLNEVVDFITTNDLSFAEGLLKLSNYEIDFKEENTARSMIKVGAFPYHKELRDFDFSFQPSINKQQIQDFSTMRFVENHENIVF